MLMKEIAYNLLTEPTKTRMNATACGVAVTELKSNDKNSPQKQTFTARSPKSQCWIHFIFYLDEGI